MLSWRWRHTLHGSLVRLLIIAQGPLFSLPQAGSEEISPLSLTLWLSPFLSMYTCRRILEDPLRSGQTLPPILLLTRRDVRAVAIFSTYSAVLKAALEMVQYISIPVDTDNDEEMLRLVKASIGTGF
jgi:hypothetical protein